ncbi:hypothetical protein SISNIDRAFT_553022 [Sistotremastrum niveocremeum HHB9708]|uniref:Uncharacterized protein n=2 Tax=Sistotremastraceae TaxID=3402574 RepID=A0A164NG69_9AGAM|nr:hypothetical protein SISNIDRAFT_553022 [Sistotremastrum niveocremeum HHB9708]KZT33121.1 hypothetical protein SISSUDRAFT_1066389 [Sistotremastrum suecicum HHB10207 ss-3]
MGRKKKYETPEERQEAAREAQRRYYESHRQAEQERARARWSARGAAQRRARKNGTTESIGPATENPPTPYGHPPPVDPSFTESPPPSRHPLIPPQGATMNLNFRPPTPPPRYDASSDIPTAISRLYQILRLGGESVSEYEFLANQARQVIAAAQGQLRLSQGYASVYAARQANVSRVVKEACALEAEAFRRDPTGQSDLARRAHKLVRSARRHEQFDEELGLFLRMENGLDDYERAFEARELLWQQG